jgi:hypothetical protein
MDSVLRAGVGHQHRQRLAGRDVHLALDAPHAEDELLHPIDLGDGVRVCGGRVGDRVGREHDGLARHARERCHLLPDLLGDEGHEGVRELEQRLQRLHQGPAGAALGGVGRMLAGEHGLGQLQVPVAELAPGELVDGLGGEVEAVGVDGLAHVGGGGVQPGGDPAVGGGELNVGAGFVADSRG